MQYPHKITTALGRLLTVAEYKTEAHQFWKGYGVPVKDCRGAVAVVLAANKGGDVPEDATHVLWFGR